MEKEFVKYETALALKELGFDEPCLAFWDGKNTDTFYFNNIRDASGDYVPFQKHDRLKWFGAPLYQQAFRWFREKHLTYGIIMPTNVSEIQGIDCILEIHPPPDKHGIVYILEDAKLYTSYEEAESACLDKLIEICKNK